MAQFLAAIGNLSLKLMMQHPLKMKSQNKLCPKNKSLLIKKKLQIKMRMKRSSPSLTMGTKKNQYRRKRRPSCSRYLDKSLIWLAVLCASLR